MLLLYKQFWKSIENFSEFFKALMNSMNSIRFIFTHRFREDPNVFRPKNSTIKPRKFHNPQFHIKSLATFVRLFYIPFKIGPETKTRHPRKNHHRQSDALQHHRSSIRNESGDEALAKRTSFVYNNIPSPAVWRHRRENLILLMFAPCRRIGRPPCSACSSKAEN